MNRAAPQGRRTGTLGDPTSSGSGFDWSTTLANGAHTVLGSFCKVKPKSTSWGKEGSESSCVIAKAYTATTMSSRGALWERRFPREGSSKILTPRQSSIEVRSSKWNVEVFRSNLGYPSQALLEHILVLEVPNLARCGTCRTNVGGDGL
jgi:hypothetical protein